MKDGRLSRFLSVKTIARLAVVAVTLAHFGFVANMCQASLADNGADVGRRCSELYPDNPFLGNMCIQIGCSSRATAALETECEAKADAVAWFNNSLD